MPQSAEDRGLAVFFSTLFCLALARFALGFLRVPEAAAKPLSLAVSIVFLIVPVLAIYKAASAKWSPLRSLAFILGGLLVQFGLLYVAQNAFTQAPIGQGAAVALSQAGLICWCVGIGALITTMLKDRNLLIPVSIFLALFDLYAVFTPSGPVQVLMRKAPQLLPSIAYQAPSVASTASTAPRGAPVLPLAFVGPADFLFMGMFFVAVFRFGLRSGETFRWMLVALAAWICLSPLLGEMPLLVPIGLSVLLVNLREFKLNKEEWTSTAVIGAIMVGVVIWGATRPRPVRIVRESQAGPSQSAASQGSPAPASSPSPTSPGPLPSGTPPAPGSTPGPR